VDWYGKLSSEASARLDMIVNSSLGFISQRIENLNEESLFNSRFLKPEDLSDFYSAEVQKVNNAILDFQIPNKRQLFEFMRNVEFEIQTRQIKGSLFRYPTDMDSPNSKTINPFKDLPDFDKVVEVVSHITYSFQLQFILASGVLSEGKKDYSNEKDCPNVLSILTWLVIDSLNLKDEYIPPYGLSYKMTLEDKLNEKQRGDLWGKLVESGIIRDIRYESFKYLFTRNPIMPDMERIVVKRSVSNSKMVYLIKEITGKNYSHSTANMCFTKEGRPPEYKIFDSNVKPHPRGGNYNDIKNILREIGPMQ
jgi:hypothetical protein